MIKFIVAVWVSGITPYGGITDDRFLIALYEPAFDTRASCEIYAIQAQDKWFAKISEDALKVTDWVGLVMNEDPECLPYNIETKEVYDDGSTL